MQVGLLGAYIGTSNMLLLQRGVRHDQHVFVVMGVRYDVASALPKILGIARGGAGTKFPFTSRLPIPLYVAVAL